VIRVKMGSYGEEGTSDMMKTFLNYPEFTRSIGRIGTRVTLTTDLPRRLAALAVLRTAWLCDCDYLWAHILADGGVPVTGAEQTAVKHGAYGDFNSLERHVLEAIDELHDTHYLSEEKWYRIGRLGSNAVLDLIVTYAFFVTLSVAVNSLGVQLEDGTGWDGERPALTDAGTGLTPPRQLPKRVFEADYSLLSPRQLEQTNRLGRRGKPTTSKLQKAMINYPEFVAAISAFGKRGIDDPCLPPRIWQIAAMRTSWLCDSEYLWAQHGKVCREKLGVTFEDLAGVAEGPDSQSLQDFDRVIVATVDDMYHHNRISDANWGQFDQFGPEGVTDLIIVYGLYVLQSCVARCFGTTLEDGVPGFGPELQQFRGTQQRGQHV